MVQEKTAVEAAGVSVQVLSAAAFASRSAAAGVIESPSASVYARFTVTVPPSTKPGAGGGTSVAVKSGRRLSRSASKTTRPVEPCVVPLKLVSPKVLTRAQYV